MLPAKDVHVLLVQLKGRLLKLYAFSRGVGEEEAEVNVDHVPVLVNEDVGIVSVLDLQDVADQRVSSEGVTEILPSLSELFSFEAEVESKVVLQLDLTCPTFLDQLLPYVVDRERVLYELNQATTVACRHDFVRPQPQLLLFRLREDLLHQRYQLHCELFLPQVIAALYDYAHQLPRLHLPKWRLLFNALLLFLSHFLVQKIPFA